MKDLQPLETVVFLYVLGECAVSRHESLHNYMLLHIPCDLISSKGRLKLSTPVRAALHYL